jgi:hypothetical protein
MQWQATAAHRPNGQSTVKHAGVVVRNMSDASAITVQRAEEDCQQICRLAGIQITWVNAVEDVTWQGPDIVLRAAILPQAPVSRRLEVFGTAFPGKWDGIQLYVYHDRIVDLSRRAELPVYLVLSGALTHEIGHMLLRAAEHSVAGVMQCEWSKRELDELGQGLLRFTPEQKRRMTWNLSTLTARQSAKLRAR